MLSRLSLAALAVSVAVAFGVLYMTGPLPLIGDGTCRGCNVLLITVDTLRADHVSCYGYIEETTPNIDSVAQDGVMFSNAFSQIPHTPPSHWSIFTGLYPFSHRQFNPGDNGTGLTTITQFLGERGYVTSGFISSRMLIGFDPQFDYFNGYSTQPEREERFLRRPAGETTDAAIRWLDSHSDERFFMWVHYYDPHTPYDPPAGFDVFNYTGDAYYSDPRYDNMGVSGRRIMRDEIAAYDGSVFYADYNIGRLLSQLDDLGLSQDTLVVITSDHGECLGEHNFTNFGYPEERACVFHGKTLYDEEVRIPLVIRNPASQARGIVAHGIVETVDIFPTIAGLLGLTPPSGTDGMNMARDALGKPGGKNYTLMQTRPIKGTSFSMGIRTEEWKFVRMLPSDFDVDKDIAEQDEGVVGMDGSLDLNATVKMLLFDVGEGERENLVSSHAETAAMLDAELRGSVNAEGLDFGIATDKETENILRSLGYIT